MEFTDVRKFDEERIKGLVAQFYGLIDGTIRAAGGPCQDLAVWHRSGQQLLGHRSKLFFEVPRIILIFGG